MKSIIIILCLFLFPTSLLALEYACNWNYIDEKYQEYLDDLPTRDDFSSVFLVAVSSDDGCAYSWRWKPGIGRLEEVMQESFNDCEKWKKKNNVEGACKPYDINKKIIWLNPDLYKELIESDKESIRKNKMDLSIEGLDDIINSKDPSTLQKVIYIGEKKRNLYEVRTDRKDKSRRFLFKATPYVFDAYFESGKIFEILIYFKNEKKKSKDKSKFLAEKYAFMIGQMPNVLLQRLDAVHIYADTLGISNASARDRVIKIHPRSESANFEFGTSIEELFIHELVHASLDKPIFGHYKSINKKRHENKNIKSIKLNWGDWRKAVRKDNKKYITAYAKTSIHEDLAESFTAWLALRYKGDRISDFQKQAIEKIIPNRIKFFDDQQFDMYPLVLNKF